MRTLLSLILISILSVGAAAACETVRFARGAVSHSVTGAITRNSAACFLLGVRPGQQFRVEVLEGSPLLSVNGGDPVYGFDGIAARAEMIVEVYSLVPRGVERFRLLFTIL